jgi:hypothetical protein
MWTGNGGRAASHRGIEHRAGTAAVWGEWRSAAAPCGEWRHTVTPPSHHCGRQGLPQVPVALGEAFPECDSRGRGFGEEAHGEAAFPECQKLHTRGRLHREAKKHSGKNYGFF